ncbi:hypothetical protein RIF29_25119 [Crotalaria pallida]|uniref:Stomatal closure-related actin-binding protein coiled-coil domain-containing protein n=1 Tax=Crotalaria pallida TaxID=3830 RepID=A0AAN9I3W5_CROPI
MEEAHEGLRIPECGLASKLAAMAASVAGGPSSSPIFVARFFSDDNLSKVTAERTKERGDATRLAVADEGDGGLAVPAGASADAKKLVDEERAFARSEIDSARAAVQRVKEALQKHEGSRFAFGEGCVCVFSLLLCSRLEAEEVIEKISEEEEVEEEPEHNRKGTAGIIEIENPNLEKARNVKAKDVDVS